MEIRIEPRIAESFPSFCIGVVFARAANAGPNAEVDGLLQEQEARVRDTFNSETFTQDARLLAWREAYRSFGVKPRDGKSSIENLIRIVLSGRPLKRVNALVDLYNLISLKYTLPVGGEDMDQIQGALWLRFATESEKPALLIGDAAPEIPPAGEVFYCDDLGAVCRKWNWREADRTKLTEQTKNAIFVLEALAPTGREQVETASAELAQLLSTYCAANCAVDVLDKNQLQSICPCS